MLLTLIILVSSSLTCLNAGDTSFYRPENNFNLSLGGNASLISLSYENLTPLSDNRMLALAGGIGYNKELRLCLFGPCSDSPKRFITFPHSLTLNWGHRRSYLEFGIGGTIITGKTKQHYLLYPKIGYRHHPLKPNKFGFQILGSYPLYNLESVDFMFSPIGITVGIAY